MPPEHDTPFIGDGSPRPRPETHLQTTPQGGPGLQELVGALRTADRTAVELVYLRGLTQAEAAKVIGTTSDVVATRVARALRAIGRQIIVEHAGRS